MNKKRPVWRVFLWVAVAVVIAGGVAFFLRPVPTQVEIASVARRQIETSVESEAKTRIHDRYIVSAPVSGRLLRLAVEEGDAVAAGARVASIDPLPMDAAVTGAVEKLRELDAQMAGVETLRPKTETLAQANTRVKQSTATAMSARERVLAASIALEQATREANRQIALEQQGYASRLSREQAESAQRLAVRDQEIARSAAAAADAQVAIDRAFADEVAKKVRDPDYLRTVYASQTNAIRAQLKTLEDQRSRTSVTAPVSGQVLRVLQKSEAYVNAGMPLLEIGSHRTLEIVADVLSADVVGIRPGNRVQVTSGTGTARLTGTVRRIEPSGFTKISALGIEEQRVNVLIDVANPPPQIGDAYRVDVRIITSSDVALAVPIAALFRCGEGWCTYAVRDGRARRTEVQVSREGSEYAAIARGLEPGDEVVLRPAESLRDGAPVRVAPPKR